MRQDVGLTAVLKGVVDYLHNAGSVLKDGDFRALVHLQGAVVERINRNSCITVDDQDELADTDVALSPYGS